MRVTVAVAILGVILVGCDVTVAPSVPIPGSSSTSAKTTATQSVTPSPVPSATATGHATHDPTPAAAPPLPDAVTVTRAGCYTGPTGGEVPPGTCTTTVTWNAVSVEGTEIEAYGVTGCLSRTEDAGDGSCLEPDTPVPPSARKLIARVPAENGFVSWTGPAWLDVIDTAIGGPRSQAI